MVIILRVKPGVDPRRYEHWARTVDAPTVHATFGSVHRWELFRIEEAAPESSATRPSSFSRTGSSDVSSTGRGIV